MSDYQKAAQIRQLLAERENATALGLKTRVEACDKQLKELGYREKEKASAPESPPKGRTASKKATA